MNSNAAAILAAPVQRLDALTGFRWWAALMVFFYHMRVFAPLPGPINRVFDQGYLGVTFFFVLSGFVLTWSMRPALPISTFYWRRIARIWPSSIVALLFAVPVFYTLAPIPEGSFLKPLDFGILILSVVLLQGWFANPVILFSGNPAAWTLTVELFFYALHPWISRVLLPLTRAGAVLFASGALVWAFAYRASVYVWPESWLAAVPMPITRLPEFLLGMGLAWAVRSGWRPRLHPLVGVGALAAVILAIAYAEHSARFDTLIFFRNELFTIAAGLAILALVSHGLRGRRSLFASKLQVRLGVWSFAFYLVHATVIYLALRVFGFQPPSWRNLGWFAAILTIDLVLAWVLYRCIEHPFEGRMRSWKNRRDERRLGVSRRSTVQ